MPQTLLAFLAILVASVAALNQQAATLQQQEDMIRSELQIMANAVALEWMETEAASVDFDGLTIQSGTQHEVQFAAADMTMGFVAETTIRYVNEEGVASVSPTSIKEVVVAVYSDRYAAPLVTHARLFAD